ncbi:MAG: ABC transporter substrate-binding protein [Ferruginibacter sp.]|nr:ABC transporter substrate-binding protein [Ferruginibacter sp.]
MKKILLPVVFFLAAFMCLQDVAAQTDSVPELKTYRIGIFAPLYLDSVFNEEGKFRFKQGMPRFIMPGVDFVNGAQIALDSIKLQNQHVAAFIYDTKSYTLPVAQLIRSQKINDLDLIIGSVKDIEYKQLADFALTKNIPFISATYPNDGGVTANPYLVMVNSTLKAHCEAIYSYILQNHGADRIFLIRKKGLQEDKVAGYFKTMNEPDRKPLLNIQTINLDSSFSSTYLQKKLDSNRQTIIIGASLDEDFATTLTAACYDLYETYPIILIGMPNWDGFKSLMKKDQFDEFPVYFTSPYYNNKWDDFSKMLTAGYAKKYKGKPADMVFKGFESTYLFTRLLTTYPQDMLSHINDKDFKVFSDYNFRPVLLKKENKSPDYFENKHLYFIRMMNGTTTKAW